MSCKRPYRQKYTRKVFLKALIAMQVLVVRMVLEKADDDIASNKRTS